MRYELTVVFTNGAVIDYTATQYITDDLVLLIKRIDGAKTIVPMAAITSITAYETE